MDDYNRYLRIIKRELKDNATTGEELYQIAHELRLPLTGIYASDEKQKHFRNNSCFIINTDRKGQAGTHWVAGINYGGHIYLYDSFGRNNLNFPSLRNRKIFYTAPDKEQLEEQTDCGQRCISALLVFYHSGLDAYLSL
jgi:hypothetical protein